MIRHVKCAILIFVAIIATELGSASARTQVVAPQVVALPTVTGPVPQTVSSYAFNSAAHYAKPSDLSKFGYVEDEYFQDGKARVYDWPRIGKLESLGVGLYKTRILVRRPSDAAHFNGAVIIEPLNPSHMADLDLMWIFSHQYLMHLGYAWIGVTVKPVSVAALKRFNAERYVSLSLANPLPSTESCPDLELGPSDVSSEVGLAQDIISQLGALVRSDSSNNPMSGYKVSRVYLTGYSQTAGYVRGYANSIAPLAKTSGDRNIFDGYLEAGHGPFNVPLNNCAKLFQHGDPRLKVGKIGVPFMDVAGEGDTLVTYFMRQPDGNQAPNLFRRYEVAGSTHSGSLTQGSTPTDKDFARAGAFVTSFAGCRPDTYGLSEFPLNYVLDAMWQNLDDWVVSKKPPPAGTRLVLEKASSDLGTGVATKKDKYGNTLGGVRTTAVDVPTATWYSSRGGPDRCMRVGYDVPFDKATLEKLYPTHEIYVQKVAAAAERLRAQRWLTPFDAQEIIAEADNAAIP